MSHGHGRLIIQDCYTSVQECIQLLSCEDRRDGVITRLDSITSALQLIQDELEFQWVVSVLRIIEQALLSISRLVDQNEIGSLRRRSRFDIPQSTLEYLLSMNFSVPKISNVLNIHVRTLRRRMFDLGLRVTDTYSTITDEKLEEEILEILLTQPNTGYKRMKDHLFSKGIKVTDLRVRQLMRIADPAGVYQRTVQRNHVIRRREYFVKYSNEIWHIDANLKLIRWGFVIRGGIDGKSRLVTYISVSSDNKADSHLRSFMEGANAYGLPLRTRTDKGNENIGIARYMIETRGTGRASHICGRSVHNQRIERFWSDLTSGCMFLYYNLFWALEQDGWLNVNNEKHVYLLHKIFIERLNLSVQGFVQGWNHHPLSTERNLTPVQIMISNLPPPEMDAYPTLESLAHLEWTSCNNLMDLNMFTEEVETLLTEPPVVENTLTTEEIQALSAIDYNAQSSSFGYDIFVQAVQMLRNQ